MLRERLFNLRLTTEEFAELESDAATSGDTMSNWVRRCLRQGRALLLSMAPSKDGGYAGSVSGSSHGKKAPNGSKKTKKPAKRRR